MGVFGDPLALSLLQRVWRRGGAMGLPWVGTRPATCSWSGIPMSNCPRTGRRSASFRRATRPAARSSPTKMGDPMKDEYDFSAAERGKFFQQGARLVPPVHLEPDVLAYLSELADAKGTSLNELVNTLLKEDIEQLDAAK